MGKKNHGRHIKQQQKHTNAHNLKSDRSQLHELVDKLLRLTTQNQNTNVNKEFEAVKEILGVLERIKDAESELDDKYCNRSRCDRSVLDRFETWLKENGATYEGASIAEFAGYDLGLKAEIDIPKDSLIIAVPRMLMITNETALKSNLNSLITKDKILQNMPNVALAIYVLLEKFSGDSFWKPYFDVLPTTYSTVLYFTGEELELLSGSPTLRSALNQIKSIARQYAYFHKMIFAAANEPSCEVLRTRFTYKQYCWAVSTIMTRQNTIPSHDDKERINALIPLWDMSNHTNGSISTDYNPVLQRCECLAVKDFKAGEQLFIFYGPRTNADLFIHNGFVFENNEHDYYPLTLGISQSDPLREKRLSLLGKLNIDPALPFKLRKDAPPMDGDLLAFLRIFNMNNDQLDHWLEGNRSDDLTYGDCALETLLEKKTWTFLQMRIKLLLASYKTTLDQDEKALSDATNTWNANLSIRMKIAEKRILHCVLDYVEQCTKQFN